MAPRSNGTAPVRRASAGRSRRALLWGLLWFVLVQAGLFAAMQTWVPYWLDPGYGAKVARLRRRLGDAGDRRLFVAALGSSMTDYGFRGGTAERALERALGRPVVVANFGSPGGGPFRELLYLRRILDDAGRPDLVLIEVLPAALVERAWPSELAADRLPTVALRRDEVKLMKEYGGAVRPGLRRAWLTARSAPCYSCRINILTSLLPNLLPFESQQSYDKEMDETGWTPLPIPDTPAIRSLHRRILKAGCAKQLDCFRLDARPVSALCRALEVCRQEGLAAALVLMPEAPSYRRLYPAGSWAQVEGLIQTLGRRYGAPVINVREWMDEEDFLDTLHLVPSAATDFSERFARTALAPLLGSRAATRGRSGEPSRTRPTGAARLAAPTPLHPAAKRSSP